MSRWWALALFGWCLTAHADPQVCWNNATHNSDGTPLNDLAAVRLYWGTSTLEYDGSLDVPTDLPGETVCVVLDLAPGEWFVSGKSIARKVKPIAGLPLAMTGTAPENRALSVPITNPVSDVVLSLVVSDADIAGEGRLSMTNWSTPIFDGQLGPDGQDHPVTYTIPQDEAAAALNVEHLTTAGFSIVSGTVEYDVESSFSNEIVKTVEASPVPPILALSPVCADCEQIRTDLLVGTTGTNVRLRWEAVAADTIEVQVLKYPGGTTPVASGSFTNSVFWDWAPTRAGLYYSRVRACTAGACGAWANSYEQGFLYFLQLKAPTPGGLN